MGSAKQRGVYRAAALACAVLLCVLFAGCAQQAGATQPPLAATVLTVDGMAVTAEEFLLFLREEKAAASSHFQSKYGAEYSDTFWTTEYGGETPLAYAKRAALEKLVLYRVESRWMQQYGIVSAPGLEGVKEALEGQKTSDSAAYGLEEYSLVEFFSYHRARCYLQLEAAYEKTLADEGAAPDLAQLYQQEKDTYFFIGSEYRCTRLDVRIADAEDEGLLEDRLLALIDDPQADLREDADWSGLLGAGAAVRDVLFSDAAAEAQDEEYITLRDFLRNAAIGDKTMLYLGQETVSVIQLDARTSLGYLPPEDEAVQDTLFQLYCSRRLKETLQQQAGQAVVQLLPEYEALSMP